MPRPHKVGALAQNTCSEAKSSAHTHPSPLRPFWMFRFVYVWHDFSGKAFLPVYIDYDQSLGDYAKRPCYRSTYCLESISLIREFYFAIYIWSLSGISPCSLMRTKYNNIGSFGPHRLLVLSKVFAVLSLLIFWTWSKQKYHTTEMIFQIKQICFAPTLLVRQACSSRHHIAILNKNINK